MTATARPAVAILWLRRDLRLHDHPALAAALEAADAVVPVYVLDPRLLAGPRSSANRTWFLLGSLRELATDLAARGAPLVVRTGRPELVIPALAAEAGARDVFATRDVSPFARARDRAVGEVLADAGRRLHLERGLLVAEPEEVHAADGRPVTVFTPFSRRWAAVPRRTPIPAPDAIPSLPAGALRRRGPARAAPADGRPRAAARSPARRPRASAWRAGSPRRRSRPTPTAATASTPTGPRACRPT